MSMTRRDFLAVSLTTLAAAGCATIPPAEEKYDIQAEAFVSLGYTKKSPAGHYLMLKISGKNHVQQNRDERIRIYAKELSEKSDNEVYKARVLPLHIPFTCSEESEVIARIAEFRNHLTKILHPAFQTQFEEAQLREVSASGMPAP